MKHKFGPRSRLNIRLNGLHESYCMVVELHLGAAVSSWWHRDCDAHLRDVLDILAKNCDTLLDRENSTNNYADGVDTAGTAIDVIGLRANLAPSRKRKREPPKLQGELLQLHWESRETSPQGHILFYNGRIKDCKSGGNNSRDAGSNGDVVTCNRGLSHLPILPVTLLVWPFPLTSECEAAERRITNYFSRETQSIEREATKFMSS